MLKSILLTSAAAAAVLTANTAKAADFLFTGAIQQWIVPTTGLYEILTFGAQGGGARGRGGRGAEAGGDFTLTAGEVLSILVGGQGAEGRGGGGGGGGSFVVDGINPLAVAGGGGGYASTLGSSPGVVSRSGGGRGAGSNGGGGSAFNDCKAGGGGGGGYSGGGGSWYGYYTGQAAAGGGGSYVADRATNVVLNSGVRTGNGEIMISLLSAAAAPVPEPATWISMITGLGLLGLVLRRRVRTLLRPA